MESTLTRDDVRFHNSVRTCMPAADEGSRDLPQTVG
jgi:hypothetical protein